MNLNKLRELFYLGQYNLVFTLIDGMDVDWIELDFGTLLRVGPYLEDTIPIKNTNLHLDIYEKSLGQDIPMIGVSHKCSRVYENDKELNQLINKDYFINHASKNDFFNYNPHPIVIHNPSNIELSKIIFNEKI